MKRILTTVLILLSIILFTSISFASEKLYKKCISCHGIDGGKNALKTGITIKGQSKSEILEKLKGYKAGSYGEKKKAIMERKVKKMSADDMDSLADYISKF